MLAFALCGVAVPFACADVAPFNYSENFNLFGDQENNLACRPNGACAAVAVINSMVFLENQYPTIYDSKLLPNYDPLNNNDPTDAANFAVDGWKVDNNPARQGYYTRGDDNNNQSLVWDTAYLATKMDWFGDYAPGTTAFASMWNGGAGYPTVAFLAQQIMQQEDVEFFVKDTGDPAGNTLYHALTLTGIGCTGANYTNCSITYQDPQNPALNQNTAIAGTGPGGSLSFNYDGSAVFIDAAFAESPVPEPSSLVLIAIGIAGLIWNQRRAKAK